MRVRDPGVRDRSAGAEEGQAPSEQAPPCQSRHNKDCGTSKSAWQTAGAVARRHSESLTGGV
jgi:hypothetical protein